MGGEKKAVFAFLYLIIRIIRVAFIVALVYFWGTFWG